MERQEFIKHSIALSKARFRYLSPPMLHFRFVSTEIMLRTVKICFVFGCKIVEQIDERIGMETSETVVKREKRVELQYKKRRNLEEALRCE